MASEARQQCGVGGWVMRNGRPAVVAGRIPEPRVTDYSLVGWIWNGIEWEFERWTLGGLTLMNATRDTDLVSPTSEVEQDDGDTANPLHGLVGYWPLVNPDQNLAAKVDELIERVAVLEADMKDRHEGY